MDTQPSNKKPIKQSEMESFHDSKYIPQGGVKNCSVSIAVCMKKVIFNFSSCRNVCLTLHG